MAQENNETDTIAKAKKYGIRVGVDLSKPIRSILDNKYSGFEVLGDFRFSEKYYAAAELGNESYDYFKPNLNAKTSGSYIKIGADYNAYQNWLGMENVIFAGLRYGFATFNQELLAYTIYINDQQFPAATVIANEEFNGLSAQWLEFMIGVKTEVANNLYFSFNFQLKRKFAERLPSNFDNLYIPGFGRTYDFSEYGVGYGYSVSYLIPIFKK